MKRLTPEQQALALTCLDGTGWIARRWARRYTDIPDLRQEARVALCQAAADYDPDRGVPFSTVAFAYMQNALCSSYAHRRRLCRRVQPLSLDLLGDDHDDPALRDSPADARAERIDDCSHSRQVVYALLSTLPQRTREILQARMQGATLAVLGQRLNLTRERVRQIECAALGRLRVKVGGLRHE
jgi:RNA polymerase sigma factor (sigma-70 family)